MFANNISVHELSVFANNISVHELSVFANNISVHELSVFANNISVHELLVFADNIPFMNCRCSPTVSPFMCWADRLLILKQCYFRFILQIPSNIEMCKKWDWYGIWDILCFYKGKGSHGPYTMTDQHFAHLLRVSCNFSSFTNTTVFFPQETFIKLDPRDSYGWHRSS